MSPVVKTIDRIAVGHKVVHEVPIAAPVLAKAMDDGQDGDGLLIRQPPLVVKFQFSNTLESAFFVLQRDLLWEKRVSGRYASSSLR